MEVHANVNAVVANSTNAHVVESRVSIPLSVLGIQTGGIVDIPEFEVLFESGSGTSGEESYGVVIETPNDVPEAILKLNELLLSTDGR